MTRVYDRAGYPSWYPGLRLLDEEIQHVRLNVVRHAAMADAPTLGATYSSAQGRARPLPQESAPALLTTGRVLLSYPHAARPFASLQRRVGDRLASHPSPPLWWHQITSVPASECALKKFQRALTTFKGQSARFSSPSSGRGFPLRPGRTLARTGPGL